MPVWTLGRCIRRQVPSRSRPPSGSTTTLGHRLYASQEDLDPHWIAEQRRAGCEFGLTDSGFIAAGDHDGLVRVLSQGAAIDRALVALPLAGQWLSMDAQVLVAEINRFGVPVAVMFEHAGDPLGREVAVRGFVQLLDETKVPILSLRGDTSGIGALALGGAAAAIGTTTGLRHIFPVKSGGRPATRAPSAFVPSAMCYRKLDTINHAIANSEFDTNFLCTCDICAGLSAGWAHREDRRGSLSGEPADAD